MFIQDLGSTNGTYVNGCRAQELHLVDGDKIRIGPHDLQYLVSSGTEQKPPEPDDTLIFEKRVHELATGAKDEQTAEKIRELKHYYNLKRDALSDLAYRDGLTGLFNRRYFDGKLQEEMDRCQRYSRPLSLILGDIDHFKHYNDVHGHQQGDEVLKSVAQIVMGCCRFSDIPARYGGEELGLILPETNAQGAFLAAEKIRTHIEQNASKIAGETVTISLGIATYHTNMDGPADLIQHADQALYTAKNAGRNCSKMAEDGKE